MKIIWIYDVIKMLLMFLDSIEVILDRTRQVMKVDITTGDKIAPQAVEYSFRLLFENRSIRRIGRTTLLIGTCLLFLWS